MEPPEERPAEVRNQRPPIKQRRCVAVCLWRAGRSPWSGFQTRLKTTHHKRLFTARLVRALGSRRVEEGRRSRRAEHAVPLPLQNRLLCAAPAFRNQPPRLPAFSVQRFPHSTDSNGTTPIRIQRFLTASSSISEDTQAITQSPPPAPEVFAATPMESAA